MIDPLAWIYAAPGAAKKGLNLIGKGLVLLCQGVIQTVRYVNNGLPGSNGNGDHNVSKNLAGIIETLNRTVANQGSELTRVSAKNKELEQRLDANDQETNELKKAQAVTDERLEICEQDRSQLREEIELVKKTNPKSNETIGGK